MEKRIKDYDSSGLKSSKRSSRSEAIRKLRNEMLEQQRILAEQQERRDRQRDEHEKVFKA